MALTQYQKLYWKSERGKEVQKLWSNRNREKRNEIQRIWREKNRDKYRAYARNDSKTEKGKLRLKANQFNRKNKTKDLTRAIIQSVYEDNIKKYGTLTCELCLKKIVFGDDSLEHLIPLSRCGSNKRDNLAVAHLRCNQKKGNKTLGEYSNKRK